MWSLAATAEPSEEPLSLEEAKSQCRVQHALDDADLTRAVAAARRFVEKETGQSWAAKPYLVKFSGWPRLQPWCGWEDAIALPIEGVTAVGAVRYYDTGGTLQTLGVDQYQTWLEHSPPLIAPAPLRWWPVLQSGRMNPVEVAFTAGPIAAAAPAELVQLLKVMVANWYQNRGDGADPERMGLPTGADRLLRNLNANGYR